MKKIFAMFSILLCCLCCAACSSGYSSIEEAEADGARLGECITIDGVNVSGMSPAEAFEAVESAHTEALKALYYTVSAGEDSLDISGSLLPVAAATLAGCVAGVLSVVYIAMAFGAEREILNSIAPKSVTVPIAVSVAGPLGGNVSVTSVVVFCVGIFGSIFGEWVLRRCGVRDPEARGFALGAAAHGIGTARAIEIGAVEGALSGLAMALMGLATALLMPLMEKYLY